LGTHILICACLPPLALDIIFAFQHLPRFRDRLMQKVQLTVDESGIQRVPSPGANVDYIEALVDRISDSNHLAEHEFWGGGNS